jgi:hypothetical protein
LAAQKIEKPSSFLTCSPDQIDVRVGKENQPGDLKILVSIFLLHRIKR